MAAFPTLKGNNLDGVPFSVPADLEGDYNVVMLAFTQRQQFDVNTWVGPLRALAAAVPQVRVYELPTMERFSPLQQRQIDLMMAVNIPDPVTRATTITVYTDIEAVREAVGFRSFGAIQLMLIDRAGSIYWRGEGAYTPTQFESLVQTVERLTYIV